MELTRDLGEATHDDSGGWSREERILVLAVYGSTRRRLSVKSPEIRELADLIERSPAAVGFKIGGFHDLFVGKSGNLRRISSMQRAAFREFAQREEELEVTADDIRNRFMDATVTIRIETSDPLFLDATGVRRIEELATSFDLPNSAFVL